MTAPILTWIVDKLKETGYFGTGAIIIFMFWAIYRLWTSEKLKISLIVKRTIISSAFGSIIGIFAYALFEQSILLLCIIVAIISFPWFTFWLIHHRIKQQLDNVLNLANAVSLKYDSVEALNKLKKINTKNMTLKQYKQLISDKIYIYLQLGNIKAAKNILKSIVADESEMYFFKFMISFRSGDMKQAENYIKKAEEVIDEDTHKVIKTEILINRGVSYVTSGNYVLAEDYFMRAEKAYVDGKLQDSFLLYFIYYNWGFNKTRLLGKEEGIKAIKELEKKFRTYINIKNYADYINLFNFQLAMLKQTVAPPEKTNSYVQKILEKFLNDSVPGENKFFFASSMTKIMQEERINPQSCMQYLKDNWNIMDTLDYEKRYNVFSRLDILFSYSPKPIVGSNDKMKQMTKEYFLHQAEKDLDNWFSNLPTEAVYSRGMCLSEKATLPRRQDKYDKNIVMEYMNNAIALYHENDLFVEENLCRLGLIDELSSLENSDKNYRPIEINEMLKQLVKVEKFVGQLKEHPILENFYLQLSFQYLLLNKYVEGIYYYEKYHDSKLPQDGFMPGHLRYRFLVILRVRVLYFVKAINTVKNTMKSFVLTPEEKYWLETFPNGHDGILETFMVGSFLGFKNNILAKVSRMVDEKDLQKAEDHVWLWFQSIGVNIDITYSQFNEDDKETIFFDLDKHPLESWHIKNLASNCAKAGIKHKVFPVFLQIQKLEPERRKLLYSLYSIIIKEIPKECPTFEEFDDLYKQVLLIPLTDGKEKLIKQ